MQSYAESREFCIRKLAQILYDCVACSHADREKLDWLTAERCVDANKPIVDGIYDCFQATMTALSGQVQDFEAFDRLCGRAVWDSLYQPLKKALQLPYQPMPHYTHVVFS